MWFAVYVSLKHYTWAILNQQKGKDITTLKPQMRINKDRIKKPAGSLFALHYRLGLNCSIQSKH